MANSLKNWELQNAVKLIDPHRDALYDYDDKAAKAVNESKPWKSDANYFKNIRISAVALLKMVMHARSGGSIEVMGLMLGYIAGDTFIVTDSFRLPVEGTETRVNAQEDANEYIVNYPEAARQAGQLENAVGWYHSHPGYGCWLSGIDVGTQHTWQMFQDPFCAVVIDPDRTISAGKVEIGAFRTYPENYKPAKMGGGDGFQTIPLDKMQDFGAHSERYYPLEVTHFKSQLDAKILEALWNKYWVGTLSQSPLFTNRDYGTSQMQDLARKIMQVEQGVKNHSYGPQVRPSTTTSKDKELEKLVRAGHKLATEEKIGLLAAELKDRVFNVQPELTQVPDLDMNG
ncbi:Mov34/MPN/PAD-1 family protein [Pseudovirgaria hyperparasitica]|uniref:COP9 signalosome complex subunit 5 n=1 Tax=Pseudovirgaria hyperparasitica TaxID=470096 RepID=A0A6A6W8M7_9PEZI|nr:Mov34/MPN/PAD-1 family protein [Pseudovirgaria hyperparasitica]KAF2758905.1 Mov34/MPN/PAD-1 family protein [Pseudovirgaria hyperparasitica]